MNKTKVFYVMEWGNGEGAEWSTDNFNEEELKVVERFLKELEEHSNGLEIESVHILDEDFN